MLKPSLAVLLSAGLACSSSADELHVPSQYATIQAAIDAAANGDGIEANVDAYYGVNGAQLSLVLPPWVTMNDLQFGSPAPFDWVTIALPGDANADGKVDLLDLDLLGQHFGATMATYAEGDFNGDGVVDLLDLDILGANFGTVGGGTVATGDFNGDGNVDLLDLDILGANFGAMASAAVPEPTAAVLAMLAGVAVLARRV